MKIGIYGDSFAEYNSNGHDNQWVVMLGKKIADSNLTNYGLSGTSVYYSYKQFLNNQKYPHIFCELFLDIFLVDFLPFLLY
jgi:hypothetical protein